MKKLLLLFILIVSISCTTDDNKTSTETTIYGKWYFEETTHCGKNSIEFKESNLFIENHFNSNCVNNSYQSYYVLENNQITFNNSTKIIIELTNEELILYNEESEIYYYYTRN